MRIDILVMQKFDISRVKAQDLIKSGAVFVDGKAILKPSQNILPESDIILHEDEIYVSRGAHKLIKAIEEFDINFKDKVVVDIGASTGGFTQVALKMGARKVYAVDVGEDQLDEKLKIDPRVVNLQNTDFRVLKKEDVLGCDLVIGDISFISLRKILPHAKELFGNLEMVFLFKPQFECGLELAKKYKGVITDKKIHINLIDDFALFLKSLDFKLTNLSFSPIKGRSGNIEYLLHINGPFRQFSIKDVIDQAFKSLN